MVSDKIDGSVKQFPYRSARVGDVFMTLPRNACRDLEYNLAEAAGATVDNHTAYAITQENWEGKTEVTYVSCSDFTMRFGRKLVEERW